MTVWTHLHLWCVYVHVCCSSFKHRLPHVLVLKQKLCAVSKVTLNIRITSTTKTTTSILTTKVRKLTHFQVTISCAIYFSTHYNWLTIYAWPLGTILLLTCLPTLFSFSIRHLVPIPFNTVNLIVGESLTNTRCLLLKSSIYLYSILCHRLFTTTTC